MKKFNCIFVTNTTICTLDIMQNFLDVWYEVLSDKCYVYEKCLDENTLNKTILWSYYNSVMR